MGEKLRWLWESPRVRAVGVLVIIVVGLAVYNQAKQDDDELTSSFPDVGPVSVVYEVESSNPLADVTMQTPTGIQQIAAAVPMREEMTFQTGAFVYISAQKQGDGFGAITCRIIVDGAVISENTSTAAYGIAACEGSA